MSRIGHIVMTRDPDILRAGHFARKQLFCRSRVIAWSHGSRFAAARRVVEPYAGKSLLDYGCGDATFLATVADLFPDAVGADVDPNAIRDCRRRYADSSRFTFRLTEELDASHNGRYDVVTCMETLEHCVPAAEDKVFADLRRLARPGGCVILSVPIEIGPSLPMKQLVRMISGWRRLGDYQYRETYSWRELVRMTFATSNTAVPRRPYLLDPADPSTEYLGHKGFNWRAMRRRVAREFELIETRFSPLAWTRGWLSSQAWFVCRNP
jgi:2-polyprenyl-3-methyl-5-hydroxy-6-metoxy-1,4-benzoquinol methylase